MRCTLFLLLLPYLSLFGGEGEDKSPPSPPNPLELKKNWWRYFDVSEEKFHERVVSYKEFLDGMLSYEKGEEQEELSQLKEEVFGQLELYDKILHKEMPSSTPAVEIYKTYSIEQLLNLKEQSLNVEREIASVNDRIALKSTREGVIQYELDREVISYHDLEGSSYDKLHTGLRVIFLRIQLAILREELKQLRTLLAYRNKEQESVQGVLKDAVKKVDYSLLDEEAIKRTTTKFLHEIKMEKEKRAKLEKLSITGNGEKSSHELICCLQNYQIVTSNIRIDNFSLLLILGEIKQALYEIAVKGEEVEAEDLKAVIKDSEERVEKVSTDLDHWKKQLERDRQEVSRVISLKIDKDKELGDKKKQEIVAIHIELDRAAELIREANLNVVAIETLIQLLRERIIEEKSITDAWGMRLVSYWQGAAREVSDLLSTTLWHIDEKPVTVGAILRALFIIAIFLLISSYVKKWIGARILSSSRFSKATKQITQKLIHYAILVLALYIALNILGVDLTNIAILAGALGVGIGFGLQPIVTNVISGFTLLFNRYLKVGDIIQTEQGEMATVKSINLQFTHITTYEGADKIIPNADLSTKGLTNWTMKNDCRRFRVPFGVAYGTNKDRLREVILEAVSKEPYVIKNQVKIPNPDIWFMQYGDSSVNFELVAWVDLTIPSPHGTATSSLLWVIDNVLTKEGIEIPFPQRVLHVKELPKSGE